MRLLSLALVSSAALALAFTLWLATKQQHSPARCPEGEFALGARCCGSGQTLQFGSCSGEPQGCGAHLHRYTGSPKGCVAENDRLLVPGGQLVVGPVDWEAVGVVKRRRTSVMAFYLDRVEVTLARWNACVRAHRCRAHGGSEPGVPVTKTSPAEANEFCRFVGGRLPSSDEWLLAAVGPATSRFPWGNTGLVCRLATFGLVRGPCAQGGSQPDVAGNRPAGASPLGFLDLAGNVAEWTLEPNGSYVARGGSFRSRRAAELKGWALESTENPADHIGFRCAYDRPAPSLPEPQAPVADPKRTNLRIDLSRNPESRDH